MDKKSEFLKGSQTPEGDSYKLLNLVKSKVLDMEQLQTMSKEELDDVSRSCGIKISNKSATTVASKFLTLAESVRDPADLYLSLKYPLPVFVSDSCCGFARHMGCRVPDVTDILWAENYGCFEKPEFGRRPNCDVDVPYIVPQEYRDISRQLPKPRGLKEAPASSNHDNTALRSR